MAYQRPQWSVRQGGPARLAWPFPNVSASRERETTRADPGGEQRCARASEPLVATAARANLKFNLAHE
jgi:hypothetical protein